MSHDRVLGAGGVWTEAVRGADGALCREVFMFDSGGERLYGSLFAAADRSRPVGLVFCSSWGTEADRMAKLTTKLATKAAKWGGAALTFHYPGFGDSTGRAEWLTLDRMTTAAVDAVAEASVREPGLRWGLGGIRLGASVAALACRRAGARSLLLVQPALDPDGYFEEILTKSRRATLGRDGATSFAFGYPVPERPGPAVASEVREELSSFDGEAAVTVHCETPAIADDGLEQFERIGVPATWRFGLKAYPELKEGALQGLRRMLGGQRP